MDQAADPATLRSYLSRKAALIETSMREDLAEALRGCDPLLIEVIEYSLFGGGKRIRPQLAVMAAALCGTADPAIHRLAAAFEYLHVATLIHDDVIDNAGERRGRSSVVHRFGTVAAILTGDWLHARSMHLVGRYAGPEGLEIFCRSTAAMVDGEFLQLRYVNNCGISAEQYFAVVRRKTGLLISSTCEIGAVFAGCTLKQRRALAEYGDKIGIAFQVIDDLLDYQGEEVNTGKKTGNDYFEGKTTLPLILALASAGPEDRRRMEELLRPEQKNKTGMEALARLIEKNNGFTQAGSAAEQLVGEAVAALEIFSTTGNEKMLSLLRGVADHLLNRDR